MRKKWKYVIGIVVLLVIILVVVKNCSKAKTGAATPGTGSESVTVTRGDIQTKIEVTGEVQPQTVVSQKSKVSGKIMKLYAAENDYVKTGQIIADIEPDYNQANTLFSTKAMLQKAEIALANARKELTDKKALLDGNFISQDEYKTAQDALKSAEIEYAQASNQYEMIRELDVPGKVLHVYATASGVVIEREINEGEMVQSSISSYGEGTIVMKIADLNKMIVKTNINEVDISKFKTGQEAQIKIDALPYEEFHGKVTKIAPMAVTENNAKVFPVEISINATGQVVKPGMTANLTIIGESRIGVLTIPIRAVFSNDQNQDIVYILPATAAPAAKTADSTKTKAARKTAAKAAKTPEGIATPVKLGANDMQMVEVVEGLKEGDKILLTEPGTETKFQGMMM